MNDPSIGFHKIWIEQCAATEGIRECFGLVLGLPDRGENVQRREGRAERVSIWSWLQSSGSRRLVAYFSRGCQCPRLEKGTRMGLEIRPLQG
jgi:hypothetical protein